MTATKRTGLIPKPLNKGTQMNLTSTLASISQRLEERRAGKWSEYRKLVALVCDGKEPDADRIASVLADNERTRD